jgi:hypothetical protein
MKREGNNRSRFLPSRLHPLAIPFCTSLETRGTIPYLCPYKYCLNASNLVLSSQSGKRTHTEQESSLSRMACNFLASGIPPRLGFVCCFPGLVLQIAYLIQVKPPNSHSTILPSSPNFSELITFTVGSLLAVARIFIEQAYCNVKAGSMH